MAGPTTLTQIDNAINIMVAESRYTLQEKGVMQNLVRKYPLGKGEGSYITIPTYGSLEAFDLSEGVDMQQAQTITDAPITITPGEVGAQVILTDKMMRHVRDNMMNVAGRILGDAMATKKDKDLITMIATFTPYLGSGSGTTLTLAYIMAASALLRGYTQPTPDPINGIFHPYQWYYLGKNLAPSGTYPIPDGISADIARNWYKGNLLGTDLFLDNNLTIASNATKGGVFSKEAIVLTDAFGPDVEKERDASLRAWEVNIVAEYGYSLYNAYWGVYMNMGATTPAGT